MQRFKFTTGTFPEEGGEGVQFEDGIIACREWVGGTWTKPFEGKIDDILHQYGGQQGFKLTWIDGAEPAAKAAKASK